MRQVKGLNLNFVDNRKMKFESDKDNSLNDTNQKIKMFAGIILLSIGIIISFWILYILGILLNNEVEVPLLKMFKTIDPGAEKILIPSGIIQLPPITFVVAGYGIIICLLHLFVLVAKTFLETGAGLLMSDLKLLLKKLIKRIANVSQEKNRSIRSKKS